MPPNITYDSDSDDARAVNSTADETLGDIDEIPASIPQTQVHSDEAAEEQLENELEETAGRKSNKRKRGSRQPSRKNGKKIEKPPEPVKSTNGGVESGDGDDDDDDDEDVYDVEKIVEHKFHGKTCFYRVRWVGYSEGEDTWEPEENLLPASAGLLAEYFKIIGGTPQAPKSARKSTSAQDSKNNKNNKKDGSTSTKSSRRRLALREQEMKTDELDNWLPSEKAASWEDLVENVETVERDENGNLFAYVVFKNGKRTRVGQSQYTQKCPRKLLEFYENHLSV